MPRRRRPKPFSHLTAARALARERLGAPPVTRVVPDPKKKRLRTPRFRPTLQDTLHHAND